MFNIALKLGAPALLNDPNPMGRIITGGIMQVTGSPFSHAEFWFDGPVDQARCFSARELESGVGWKTLDLRSREQWKILPLGSSALPKGGPEPSSDGGVGESLSLRDQIYWFLQGNVGRDYDAQGILGILVDRSHHNDSDRFCSEMVWDLGQQCLGWRRDIPRWKVAPGWARGGDRFGLYELWASGALMGPAPAGISALPITSFSTVLKP